MLDFDEKLKSKYWDLIAQFKSMYPARAKNIETVALTLLWNGYRSISAFDNVSANVFAGRKVSEISRNNDSPYILISFDIQMKAVTWNNSITEKDILTVEVIPSNISKDGITWDGDLSPFIIECVNFYGPLRNQASLLSELVNFTLPHFKTHVAPLHTAVQNAVSSITLDKIHEEMLALNQMLIRRRESAIQSMEDFFSRLEVVLSEEEVITAWRNAIVKKVTDS